MLERRLCKVEYTWLSYIHNISLFVSFANTSFNALKTNVSFSTHLCRFRHHINQKSITRHTCWPNRCLYRHMMPRQSSRTPLGLNCWNRSVGNVSSEEKRTWGGTTELPPVNPSILLIKKHKSHSALQLYVSLQGVSQLSASYSNPQLLPARNLTVRNLSARRLKPEECYCSGHSCTSTGLATAATVWVWGRGGRRGAVEEGGREEGVEGVKKATLRVSSALRSHDKATHSWQQVDTFLRPGWLQSSLHPSLPLFSSIFLQHHMYLYVYISRLFFQLLNNNTHAQSCRKHGNYAEKKGRL